MVTLRCEVGDVPDVRGEHLAVSDKLIIFPDGKVFAGISAALIDGRWRAVNEATKRDGSQSYVLQLDRYDIED